MYQVVLVDDEKFVLDGLKTAIDWSGFNLEIVFTTTNPILALEYLKTHPTHLLITDISMPQLSGIELIKEVKKFNPLVSILVLSAYDMFDYVRSAMRNGAENYLLKPLNPDELSESISAIVEHLQERNELSDIYGSTMLTFRSNFVENWVKGTLSEDEFYTRASMLGINLQLDNYTVLIFSTTTKDSQKMSQLFDYLLSLFVGSYLSHFYFETPYCLVCIISNHSGAFHIHRFLSDIDKMRPILAFPFFVSVGNTVNNYEDVRISYRNAFKHQYLKYTEMTCVTCQDFSIPLNISRMIEQDYLTFDEEQYIKDMEQLILEAKTAAKCMSYELAIVGWGISQIPLEQTPGRELIKLLSSIVCDGHQTKEIQAYVKKFILGMKDILLKRQELQKNRYPCVDAVMAAVHDFSNKEISLKTMAAKLNMHPSYLGNIFHQQTGFYFNDYLNEERLKYAAELMGTTNTKLKDIVDQAGFSSQAYFNRLFKRRFGTSPNTYRREAKMKTQGT